MPGSPPLKTRRHIESREDPGNEVAICVNVVDHFGTGCAWARTLNRKKSDVQTIPGQIRQCLHEEISTLLAGSTRVLRRVTRQGGGGGGGLTRFDYCFHVNAYKHLTAKGLPAAVIQPGVKSNPGSCKEALISKDCAISSILQSTEIKNST